MPRRVLAPRRLVAAALTLGVIGASGGVIGATAARGVPQQSIKSQIAAAQHQLHVLRVQAEQAAERYNQARDSLQTAQHNAQVARDQLATAQAKVSQLQKVVVKFAVAAYQGDSIDPLLSLTDGSTSDFIDRVSSLQAVSVNQSQTLAQVLAAQRVEEQARSTSAAALAKQQSATSAMKAARDRVVAAANKQQGILQRLEARERQIEAAARQRAQREAAARAAAQLQQQAAATQQAAAAVTQQAVSPPVVTGSGGAKVAVEWAYRELGKPYVWGAAGPNAFDCSGLTMYVWAKAGVHLDHYTGSQWNEGVHVSQSQLQPGDLVFFGSDLHHVGIYVGGGNMIDAPYTGVNVRVEPYDRPDYAGAVRPG